MFFFALLFNSTTHPLTCVTGFLRQTLSLCLNSAGLGSFSFPPREFRHEVFLCFVLHRPTYQRSHPVHLHHITFSTLSS